jgi:hypothetical protein
MLIGAWDPMAATDATDPDVIINASRCQALHQRNSCLLQDLKV